MCWQANPGVFFSGCHFQRDMVNCIFVWTLRTVMDIKKVVNCTRAQPVFHRFGCLARGKVISVTVLS